MSRTTLITGASSGIGYELARLAAADGSDVVLAARSEERLRELAERIEQETGRRAHVVAVDLARTDGPGELIRRVEELGVTIDELINNAGFGELGPFHREPWEQVRGMIQVNVMALVELTHAFLPGMIERRRGRILNVASTAAFQPGPLMAIYFATKAFVLSFSEAIAQETAGLGVGVTALCPGPTESEFFVRAQMEKSGLVKGRKMPTSREVAEYGYDALKRGRVVAVHGWRNWLLAQTPRIAPRSLVRAIVRSMNAER